ncbi:MAG: hypothetical protein MAG715_00456 [Methanonatronarchaeales archaeon]|nr:hypothetical protein [Methanonatronarchaeales archaeon]
MLTESLEGELSLLRRHLEVLRTVRDQGPIGIRRLAEETGLTQSKVRYSLRVLEKEGFVEPSERGAKQSGGDLEDVRQGLRELETGICDILDDL